MNEKNLWTKKELLAALKDNILDYNLENLNIDEVVIDSRKTPKNGLFIALKGEKNDAHNFLKQAFENGCKTLLIQDKSFLNNDLQCNFILTKDTNLALNQLAKFSRNRSTAKVIAVTGSVGKTSVKEMLKLSFSAYGKTYATIGNLNNHFGVPLSLCNFSKDCKFGIFEMGMNHLNEISPLSNLVKPHLAIITNVKSVHIEFFKNEQEIALAKSEIFDGLTEDGFALINEDNIHKNFLKDRAKIKNIKNIITFGEAKSSSYQLESYKIKDSSSSQVFLKNKNNEFSYEISTANKIIISNSIIVFAALDLLIKNPQIGLQELTKLEIANGRGKIIEKNIDGKNILIIDDSYNASLASIASGLEYASDLKLLLKKKRVIAALGDMLELGEKSTELHKEIAKYIEKFNIDFSLLVGEKMTEMSQNLNKDSYKKFTNSNLLSLEIKNLLKDGDILYIKGSRGMKMENILKNI